MKYVIQQQMDDMEWVDTFVSIHDTKEEADAKFDWYVRGMKDNWFQNGITMDTQEAWVDDDGRWIAIEDSHGACFTLNLKEIETTMLELGEEK